MPLTLADSNPELARKLGIDLYQADRLKGEVSRWENAVVAVTFREPPLRSDGKNDPIAYLPPGYATFAIVDRDHRLRVQVGESWVCEVVTRGAALFLIPLFRLTLQSILDLKPEFMKQVAETTARYDPTTAKALAEKIAPAAKPGADKETQKIKDDNARLTQRLGELESERNALESRLDELEAKAASAVALSPTARMAPAQTELPVPKAATPRTDPTATSATVARRTQSDVLESRAFVHEGYETHFTPDLLRLVLRPSRSGFPCHDGRAHTPGLARVDPSPAPRSYGMTWDDRLGAFVVYLDQARQERG